MVVCFYSAPSSTGTEPCELQLDFWFKGDKAKLNKDSLKGFFKYIQIQRDRNTFRLNAAMREKKAKCEIY